MTVFNPAGTLVHKPKKSVGQGRSKWWSTRLICSRMQAAPTCIQLGQRLCGQWAIISLYHFCWVLWLLFTFLLFFLVRLRAWLIDYLGRINTGIEIVIVIVRQEHVIPDAISVERCCEPPLVPMIYQVRSSLPLRLAGITLLQAVRQKTLLSQVSRKKDQSERQLITTDMIKVSWSFLMSLRFVFSNSFCRWWSKNVAQVSDDTLCSMYLAARRTSNFFGGAPIRKLSATFAARTISANTDFSTVSNGKDKGSTPYRDAPYFSFSTISWFLELNWTW